MIDSNECEVSASKLSKENLQFIDLLSHITINLIHLHEETSDRICEADLCSFQIYMYNKMLMLQPQ